MGAPGTSPREALGWPAGFIGAASQCIRGGLSPREAPGIRKETVARTVSCTGVSLGAFGFAGPARRDAWGK